MICKMFCSRSAGQTPRRARVSLLVGAWLRPTRLRVVLAATVLVGLAGSRDAHAQITGSIAGSVRDASGGALAGATLTLRGSALPGTTLQTATEPDGTYRFLLVPTGTYEVSVALTGFSPQVRRDVEVAINQQTTVDFALPVAGVSESVSVTTAPPLVEVTRTDVASRVQARTVAALPLNGRNFVDLVGLAPGALPVPAGQPGANVSIFGERGVALSFLVDGAENNDPLNGGPSVRLTQDAVQEFEVITSGYEAQFGRAQGGVVNLVTRSGTNSVEGHGFAFFRSDRLDSSNVPDQQPPALDRAQWGGTVGGPLRRDRLFFFGSAEKLHETRGVNVDRTNIPAFLLSGLATPGGIEDFGRAPQTASRSGLAKLDWTVDDRSRLSLSASQSNQDQQGELSSPIAGTIPLPSAARTQRTDAFRLAARGTTLLPASTFLESTGIFIKGRNGSNLERVERPEPILVLLRSGFVQTAAPFDGKSDRTTTRAQVTQSIGHYGRGRTGSHQLKVGWDANHVTVNGFNTVSNDLEYSAAFLSPDAQATNAQRFTQLGFAQSVARFFSLSANPNGSLSVGMTDNSLSVYGQDVWHPHEAITIDLGLRYDWASLFRGDHNNMAPRIGVAWDLGGRHQTVVRANWGAFFDRNLLSAAATVPEKGGVFTRSVFDVALPRLGSDYTDSLIDLVITSGFPGATGDRGPAENPAYTPFANALRANPYVLYDLLGITVADRDRPPVVTADNVGQLSGRSPAEALALLESTFPGTDFEFFDVPGGSLVGNRVLSFFPRGPLTLSRDVSRYAEDRTPWTRALSIGIDRKVPGGVIASVVYVHRRTRDLLTRRIVNLLDVPPGNPSFGLTVDGGPRISQVTYEGWIDYDGVIVSARKQVGDRYQFGASYTGSRARDNLLTGGVGSTFSNNNHPELDSGPSNQSAPHIVVANGLVTLPWDLLVSGIVYWRSGAAFNPRGIQDLDGDGLVDQRDTTQPRNSFRTAPFGDVDVRIEKTVRLPRRQTLSVLVEAFNLTNRANVLNVNAVSGPDFGRPNTFLAGREVQTGVRYRFGGP
jgi:hypothetical protein